MAYRVAVLVAAAGVLAGAALASATHVSPAPGAVVPASHPVFTWTLPSNERSAALYIANSPDRNPDGTFYEENVVDAGAFANDERRYTAASALYAGQYWWLVSSTDRATSQSFYSTPTDFTIPVALTLYPVKTVRSTYLHMLVMSVRWTANVHGLTVRARVLRRGRLIWQQAQRQVNRIGTPGSTSFGWNRPRRIKQGTRLELQVSLRANGTSKSRAITVRAP
jgi:hypothetical protein